MMNNDESIFVIGKREDYVTSFWKLPRRDCNEESIINILKFLDARKKFVNFSNYSGIARLELWNRDDFTELYEPGVYNVDGLPWPKHIKEVTLFPRANIQTESDLREYNNWRMSVFKSFLKMIQSDTYVWKRQDGQIPIMSLKEGWRCVNIDDISPLNPVELKLSEKVIRAAGRYLSVRKNSL